MEIKLDEEQWELADTVSLLEVLAQISDKAQAKHRLVTSLWVGGKKLTDRDLHPALLSRIGSEFGTVQATSQTMADIVAGAAEQLQRFAASIRRQGEALIGPLRSGTANIKSVDGWLGLLADYVEGAEVTRPQPSKGKLVSPWIEALLEARSAGDVVRLADLLEYELLPCLSERS